jgi:cyclopropane-fatty-acyl-phospholipid synthase
LSGFPQEKEFGEDAHGKRVFYLQRFFLEYLKSKKFFQVFVAPPCSTELRWVIFFLCIGGTGSTGSQGLVTMVGNLVQTQQPGCDNRWQRAKARTLKILELLFGSRLETLQGVAFRLWDGTLWPPESPAQTILVLTHPRSLRNMLLGASEAKFGASFLQGDFDVIGPMEPMFALADELAKRLTSPLLRVQLALLAAKLPAEKNASSPKVSPPKLTGRKHSLERDREAVSYHYDHSDQFFSLWLDSQMVYSCAYFRTGEETLDQAQAQKLQYICRKLRLSPGQRFLDIGCGWGSLIMHAARFFGVQALGITLSKNQVLWAQKEIKKRGLEDRCRVQLCDYREVEGENQWDAIASVGMVEHVGTALLPTYFATAYRLLRPGGVFLNHGIAAGLHGIPQTGTGFVETYVFPDGELAPISVSLRAAEEAGFEIRDLESLREHYMRTMRMWLGRLEERKQEAVACVGEVAYRKWRLFMSGSAYAFCQGKLNIYQALLLKGRGGPSGLPLTREDWYQDGK